MYIYSVEGLSLFIYIKRGKVAYIKITTTMEKSNAPDFIKDIFDEYFINKKDIPISDIFLIPQKYEDVYRLLKEKITFGSIISYKALGEMLNLHQRAVARAMKINPLPIFIPCHRVVPSVFYKNKQIGGYNAGAEVKRFLLSHENVL